jgi:membrane associated rhomboid family serine protease
MGFSNGARYLASVPVTVAVAILLVTMYILSACGVVRIDCRHRLGSIMASVFAHGGYAHIIANLLALVLLSRIEYEYGSMTFLLLCVCLTGLTSAVEFALRFIPSVNCSIGFSGVILGLAVFELMKHRKLGLNAILAMCVVVIYPSLTNPHVSIVGHAVGAIIGLILAFAFTPTMVSTLKGWCHSCRVLPPLVGHRQLFHLGNPLTSESTPATPATGFRYDD